jgi:NitT/TauT family transport system substrate-binding protein
MPLKKIVNEVSSAIYSLPWYVARDEGFFRDGGLDLEFVPTSQEGTPKNGSEDTRLVNPIVCHAPFEDGQVKLFRACEEGNVRRAYDLSKKTVAAARCASPACSRAGHFTPSSSHRTRRSTGRRNSPACPSA